MHEIEPYYNWRSFYTAENDPNSPFFENEYSEFYFTDAIYNHYIHPQWDNIESPTLFIKILFANYEEGICIIELFGEWNDALHNDIMHLKRNIIDHLAYQGIDKYIFIGDNILNFHYSDDSYYEEWFEEVMDTDGWIVFMNMREHVIEEMKEANIDSYIILGGVFEFINWRTFTPIKFYQTIANLVTKRIE